MSKTKNELKSLFQTGMRPTAKDFEDLIESMITGEDDKIFSKGDKVGIGIKEPKEKLDVDGAVKVGDTNGPDATPGTIRFNNNAFEGRDGTSWVKFGGGESVWSSNVDNTEMTISPANNAISPANNELTGYILDFLSDTRAVTLSIFANKIELGNGPALKAMSIENGRVVTLDNELKTVGTVNYKVLGTDRWIICNFGADVTLTLPEADQFKWREIMVKTVQAQAVNSASANVVGIATTTTTNVILPRTAGAWATLVSDGTNWIIMQRGQ